MKKLIIIFFALSAILLVSCSLQYAKKGEHAAAGKNSMDVDLIAEDGIRIKGTFYNGSAAMPSIILLHMLGRTRGDWNDFAVQLQNAGYNVISIDSRGHGQSSLNWRFFSADDFNRMVLDVKSAKEFLANSGIGSNVAVIGASIGANTALNFAAQDSSIKAIALVSPGMDYRGIKTREAINHFDNPILIIASQGDAYAYDSSITLNSMSKNSILKIYNGSGHGTAIFGDTDAGKDIIYWLKANLR